MNENVSSCDNVTFCVCARLQLLEIITAGLRALLGLCGAKLHSQLAPAIVNGVRVGGGRRNARNLPATLDERVVDVEWVELRRGDAQRTSSDALIRELLEVLDDGHGRTGSALPKMRWSRHPPSKRAQVPFWPTMSMPFCGSSYRYGARAASSFAETHASEPRANLRRWRWRAGSNLPDPLPDAARDRCESSPQERVRADEQEFIILIRAHLGDVIRSELLSCREVRARWRSTEDAMGWRCLRPQPS